MPVVRFFFATVCLLLTFQARADEQAAPQSAASVAGALCSMHAPVTFTLRSGIAEGRMVYIGGSGDISGKTNPTLTVHEGETVQVTLINGEGAEHDIVLDEYAARTQLPAQNPGEHWNWMHNWGMMHDWDWTIRIAKKTEKIHQWTKSQAQSATLNCGHGWLCRIPKDSFQLRSSEPCMISKARRV